MKLNTELYFETQSIKCTLRSFLSFIPVLLVFVGCTSQNSQVRLLEKQISDITKEYDLTNASYLITKDGKTVTRHYTKHELQDSIGHIIHDFSDALALDLYIKDSTLSGDSSLAQFFSNVTNKGFKISDLLIVPADNFAPDIFNPHSVYKMTAALVKTAYDKRHSKTTSDFINQFENINSSNDAKILLTTLADLSTYFDENYTVYAPVRDSFISNLFPTWYTENKSLFFGWKILKLQNHTILWNCFNKNSQTVLLMKFMDEDIFAGISYDSKTLPTPYDYDNEDLLQSPIAVSFVKSVLMPPALNVQINYKAPWKGIEEQMRQFKDSPYRLLETKDLISHARYYDRSGDKKSANKLYNGYLRLTGDSLLLKYLNQPLVADVGYVSNNLNTSCQFTVDKDGYYQIFAGGQVLQVSDYNSTPYQYDDVQIYLNQNTYYKPFKKDETQVFHFNYRFNKVAGMQDDRHSDNWLKNTKIRFAFSDPTDTSYILEVAIPWSEITHKGTKEKLGMNILLNDADYEENKRETILSWSTKPGKGWDDPGTYGILALGENASSSRQYYNSKKASNAPIIDGVSDKVWDDVLASDIKEPYFGSPSNFDNSGWFKSLYDDSCLYFLFYINDNSKNKTGLITKDKCWIERADGELMWKLPADTTDYMPSYSYKHRIYLRAGVYNLRYLSDKGHSFEGWFGKPPKNDIYGGVIYKAIN